MSYEDRIKKALYTSATGRVIDFSDGWDEAEESFDHRASVFRFPKVEGAFVSSQGTGESRFPIEMFIHGEDYDIEAAEVMEILKETGNGVLEHPIYGRKTVQPTNVKRKDNPTTNGGQAIISVLFIESTPLSFPGTEEDIKKRLEELQNSFDDVTPSEYALQRRDDSALDSSNIQARFDTALTSINDFMAPVAELSDTVNAQFNAISLSINNGLTTLVGKPLVLASQFIALIKTPGRVAQSLDLRILGYTGLAQSLRERATITSISNDSRNSLLENSFLLASTVAALAETLLLENFFTKSEALTAANSLILLHNTNRDFLETEQTKFEGSPLELLLYGDSQNTKTLNEIVQITASKLADLSFNLRQERVFTTASDRTIIDLTFELYGDITLENIDLLISSNNLTGNEIILIPRNREIIYYV